MAATGVPGATMTPVDEAATLVGAGMADQVAAAGMGVRGEADEVAAGCSIMASCVWSCLH
jgi:hypothetical protein